MRLNWSQWLLLATAISFSNLASCAPCRKNGICSRDVLPVRNTELGYPTFDRRSESGRTTPSETPTFLPSGRKTQSPSHDLSKREANPFFWSSKSAAPATPAAQGSQAISKTKDRGCMGACLNQIGKIFQAQEPKIVQQNIAGQRNKDRRVHFEADPVSVVHSGKTPEAWRNLPDPEQNPKPIPIPKAGRTPTSNSGSIPIPNARTPLLESQPTTGRPVSGTYRQSSRRKKRPVKIIQGRKR